MGRRVGAGLAALVLVVGAAACSSDEPTDEQQTLELDDAPSASESSEGADDGQDLPPGTPEIRPAPEQGQPIEETGYGVHAIELPADDPARAAAQAFVDYLDVRTGAFNTGQQDLVTLSGVAQGDALTSVQSYVADLASRDARTVGDTWISIADDQVQVDGREARLTGFCIQNASVDVGPEGTALESPPDAYRVDAQVRRVGPGAWLVQSFTPEAVASC